jgi:hypothetical protein
MKQLCVCVCVCVCEEEETFTREFRAELSALSAASNQDEGNDLVFKKCSYMSKYNDYYYYYYYYEKV